MHRKQHLLRNKVLFTAKSQLGSKNVTKHVYIFKDLFGYLEFFCLVKGQLISKYPFGVMVWTKIPTK